MWVVDTNILVYAIDQDCPEYNRCRTLLEEWRRGPAPWYVTWSILYEFLRVSTHPRVFRRPLIAAQSWSVIEHLLASRTLQVLVEGPRHVETAADVLRQTRDARGNLMHDLHTAVLMKEHGIRRIYTRDTDFHRFPFLDVQDPLSP